MMQYEKPDMEIVLLESEDVITVSMAGGDTDSEGGDFGTNPTGRGMF